jgi:hypothetical protein
MPESNQRHGAGNRRYRVYVLIEHSNHTRLVIWSSPERRDHRMRLGLALVIRS